MTNLLNKAGIKSYMYILLLHCLFAISTFAQTVPQNNSGDKAALADPNTAELGEFIKRAELELNRTMLVGEGYAQIKIRVPKAIKKLDYSNLLSVLGINNFTAIRTNDLIKVIPIKDARNSTNPVVEPKGTYYDDEFVTDFITLSKACASKILPALRPMIPPPSHLAPSHDRLLVLTDTYGNIQRIKKVVEKLEKSLNKIDDCQSL